MQHADRRRSTGDDDGPSDWMRPLVATQDDGPLREALAEVERGATGHRTTLINSGRPWSMSN
jgi:hypothetical protein